MFESRFLEFFSHVHPATPLVIYVPLIVLMLDLALRRRSLGVGLVFALVVFGLVIWTLVEYTMHRWVFHYQPTSGWGKQLHFLFHGVHHDYPKDASRLVMPPIVSIPLAAFFYRIVPPRFRDRRAAGIRGISSWLSFLRHGPLRDPSFFHEERRLALVEEVPYAPSLR